MIPRYQEDSRFRISRGFTVPNSGGFGDGYTNSLLNPPSTPSLPPPSFHIFLSFSFGMFQNRPRIILRIISESLQNHRSRVDPRIDSESTWDRLLGKPGPTRIVRESTRNLPRIELGSPQKHSRITLNTPVSALGDPPGDLLRGSREVSLGGSYRRDRGESPGGSSGGFPGIPQGMPGDPPVGPLGEPSQGYSLGDSPVPVGIPHGMPYGPRLPKAQDPRR